MTTARGTAPQRRAQAVQAGMRAFADRGLTTTAVREVAERIGVSQPYVFRLFGSKRDFFLACLDEFGDRVSAVFRDRAANARADARSAMGAGFRELVADGVASGLWLQACAAARGDEAVAARCRVVLARLLAEAEALTGADADELAAFLADGSLVIFLQALRIDLTDGTHTAVATLRAQA